MSVKSPTFKETLAETQETNRGHKTMVRTAELFSTGRAAEATTGEKTAE